MDDRSAPQARMPKARLHHHNGRYSVLFDGKLLVGGSRDPECDAARALLAQGITGKLTLCDGKTGRPRTIMRRLHNWRSRKDRMVLAS